MKTTERSHVKPLTQSLTLGRARPKCLNYLLCNYSSFYRSETCSLPACSSSYWQDSVPTSCGARASLPGSFLQDTCLITVSMGGHQDAGTYEHSGDLRLLHHTVLLLHILFFTYNPSGSTHTPCEELLCRS